ncbi:anti-sigma factor [Aciditerrimonas ferrireducens]|jgi:anti-sigma factor RsiW|uniref:anti-sigma factor n=1 Tax=Aciditerrimonas ferrireducens TaxID=667306 RepID=UPI002003BBDF|nr:anti-sigma factor [Aciditerrimonas ferrireducens]MCK4178116.1 anti-sigma factor [Aciditerrimonas ferrireducens]
MGGALSHAEASELLGAYALDAVEADEATAVAAHLASCPACRNEVDQLRAVAAVLAWEGADAPPELWDRISAGLGTEPPGISPNPPRLAPLGARVSPAQRHRSWVRRSLGAIAAAAAVAIGVLAVQVGTLDHRVGQLSALAAHQGVPAAAAQAMADPRAERVALTAVGAPDRTVADLVILPDGTAFLVEGNLPALPPGRTYQLWGMEHGQAVSLGLLGRQPRVVAFAVHSPLPIRAFAVTAEPAGGVVVATSPPVAEGQVVRT